RNGDVLGAVPLEPANLDGVFPFRQPTRFEDRQGTWIHRLEVRLVVDVVVGSSDASRYRAGCSHLVLHVEHSTRRIRRIQLDAERVGKLEGRTNRRSYPGLIEDGVLTANNHAGSVVEHVNLRV